MLNTVNAWILTLTVANLCKVCILGWCLCVRQCGIYIQVRPTSPPLLTWVRERPMLMWSPLNLGFTSILINVCVCYSAEKNLTILNVFTSYFQKETLQYIRKRIFWIFLGPRGHLRVQQKFHFFSAILFLSPPPKPRNISHSFFFFFSF